MFCNVHDHACMDKCTWRDLPTSNDPTTPLAFCPASVSGLPVMVLPIPAVGELERDLFSQPRIFVAHTGQGRRWYQLGAQTRALRTAPRMIEIYEGGLRFGHCRWEGEAGRCVMIAFANAEVQALTHGQLQRLDLRTQHELFDDRISSLALELAQQALQDLPEGRLYAQGLGVALLGLLAAQGGQQDGSASARGAGRLAARQQQRLEALIEDHPAADLSLTRLADEVGLSPHHFVRVFKASFGTTPHRYVQQRRLEAAAAALRRDDRRPIAEIALAHGFASQSHMTELMRRRLGLTPRALRRC